MPVLGIEAFERAPDLSSAWEMLKRAGPSGRLVAGGTDLTIHCPPGVTTLIDLAPAGLDRIEVAAGGAISVGATATLTQMMEHPDVVAYQGGVVVDMLRWVGSPLLRNAATIGGHLARGYLSDVIPVMLAVDAYVGVYDGVERELGLEEYYDAEVHRTLHILTKVVLPEHPSGGTAVFRRFSRSGFDYALANACCRVAPGGGGVEQARIVTGAGPGVARRIRDAEARLVETGLTDDAGTAAVASVMEALRDAQEYRRHLASVLVADCLDEIRRRLGEAP